MNSFLVHNSQSLADTLRSLDFQQWMAMLEKVFSASLNVLRRMQVSVTQAFQLTDTLLKLQLDQC